MMFMMLGASSTWVHLGSPITLTLLWLTLGTIFVVLLRKVLRNDDDLGNPRGL